MDSENIATYMYMVSVEKKHVQSCLGKENPKAIVLKLL